MQNFETTIQLAAIRRDELLQAAHRGRVTRLARRRRNARTGRSGRTTRTRGA
jgi:hypothetical protein